MINVDAKKYDILIVDDDIEILNAIERLLSRDYTIHKATNSLAALEVLKDQEIPIAIIDFNLEEEKTGIELASMLKNTYPLMQVLMLTGEQSMQTVISALNSGAIDAFMNKPIHSANLTEHISKNLDIWSQRKSMVDETIVMIQQGGLGDNLDVLRMHTSVVIGLLKASVDIGEKATTIECIGLRIASSTTNLYRDFYEESVTIKHDTMFAGFVESLSRLHDELFIESQDHLIQEIALHDVTIYLRSENQLNYTIFIHGEPEDKRKLHTLIDLLAQEISPLILSDQLFLPISTKQAISTIVNKFREDVKMIN
jgi:DNA-binding response OmpR family regulator